VRTVPAVTASIVLAGALVTLMMGSTAAAAGPAAQASGSIAVVGVTLKTDIAAVVTSHPDGTMQFELPLSAAVLPVSAAWSPDGKELALDAAGGVFVIGADGRGFRQVTRTETGGTVSWSPDGKWIAFIDNTAYGYWSAAYAVSPDGTGRHQLLEGFDAETLAWAPGGRIAFLGWPNHPGPPSAQPPGQHPPAGLWTADSDGTHAKLVAGPNASADIWVTGWSPDGRWLLFSYGNRLVEVPAAGGRPRVLLTTASPAYVAAAAWSPGGSTIIVAVNPNVSSVAPVRYYRIPASGGRAVPVDLPPMRYVSGLTWAAG